tara:strand:- start:1429 stop:1665 length:237 start_codon:yes stop_codon:yes gene_type:complete
MAPPLKGTNEMKKLKKFRVVATMDVGYAAVIEAKNEEQAWAIAREDEAPIKSDPEWKQIDEGHDWNLEDVYEIEDERN